MEELIGRIGGERSFLIPLSLTGCRKKTWVMVNKLKVDQARGAV
jgi:hypothetical protein